MSYNFILEAKDGVLTIPEHVVTMHVPDGTFQISGHEDDHSRSLNATRTDAAGMPVVAASGVGYLPKSE